MEKVMDDFFGLDAIAAENATRELIAHGEKSIDLVIGQFQKRSHHPLAEKQLGDLFGHFGNAALPKLITILKEGNWGAMSWASPCFRSLPHEPAGSRLIDIVKSSEIDRERLAIEAMGYLGNPDWSFMLKEKVSDNDDYLWEKLSFYLFVTYLRIAIRATTPEGVRNAFFYIQEFYKLAGSGKFRDLWYRNTYSMEIIFSDFKPVAADVIIASWLKHSDSFFRELGVKALGWMRLNRGVKLIREMALDRNEAPEVVRQCAESLSMIDSVESALALKEIYEQTQPSDDHYKGIGLFMSMTLGRIPDRIFIEKMYPTLLDQDVETKAHVFYNLGLLGFDESIWMDAISSEEYIVRASVAPAYARRKGSEAIPKLLQMYREASHHIESTLMLSALMIAGHTAKKEEFLSSVYSLHKSTCLRMLRVVWKREIVFALYLVETEHSKIWESMAGIEMPRLLDEIAELENFIVKPLLISPKGLATPQSTNNAAAEVFISYSWGGESEKVAMSICNKLLENKFHVVPDKILGYKGNIRAFMEGIGMGKYVVVVVSDKYLKSDNCMFEMLELKRRGDLHKRIFPIVLKDAKIYKEYERIDYIIYWDSEIDLLNKKIGELKDLSGTGEAIEKLNEYRDIRRIISEITNLLRNMNTLSLETHQDDDFTIVIDSIRNAMEHDT